MTNWQNDLEDFFGGKGISKTNPEFNEAEEREIQSFIDESIKSAFHQLEEEFNKYPNMNTDTLTSKIQTDSIREHIEFNMFKTMQKKFSYRPKFSNEGGTIKMTGQFCIPNFYGESREYSDSTLSLPIVDITEQAIIDDFMTCFKEHVDLKK